MYRVAVVLNESETQRYKWADVVPVLRTAVDRTTYTFEAFTAANIQDFFYRKNAYDSIFISANACNDELLYAELVRNREHVIAFLHDGKGIFVSFQKRLADYQRVTGFLPEEYEYQILGRQEPSAEGSVEIASGGAEHILLRFPHRIAAPEILHRCRNNDFKAHLYRGTLKPANPYNFTALLLDPTYGDLRNIFMCSRYDFRARVVISTMPLDWEGHVHLLGNVLTYITEGVPLVAFIERRNSRSLDFDYLVSTTRFHRIPSRVYDVERLDDTTIRIDVHKFHVLGAGWSDADCAAFWKRIRRQDHDCRLYALKKTADDLPSLVVCSEHSFSDSIIQEAIAWINSRFRNGRYQTSFWITHDVVEVLITLGLPTDSIKEDVVRRGMEHDKDGSYDGLMGATCALIEVYAWLLGQSSDAYQRSLNWIVTNFDRCSKYDQQTAILTLARLSESYDVDHYRKIGNDLTAMPAVQRLELTEVDICRNAEFLLLEGNDGAIDWTRDLAARQDASGRWTNAARTASTVIFLVTRRPKLAAAANDVDQMIYRGISFLSAEFNREGTCWYGDVLTTAKAILALYFFQRLLTYPVEEAFLSIRRQRATIERSESSIYASQAIDSIRTELVSVRNERDKHARVVEKHRKLKRRVRVARSLVIFMFIMAGAFVEYIAHEHLGPRVLHFVQMFMSDLRYIVPAVILFLISISIHVWFIRAAERRSEAYEDNDDT